VLRESDFVVHITVQVIGQEADSHDVGHQHRGQVEELILLLCYHGLYLFQVATGKSFVGFSIELYFIKILFILGCGVGDGPDGIPEIVKKDAGSDGVQVNNRAGFVTPEKQVVNFGVVVGNALWNLSGVHQLLDELQFLATFSVEVQDVLYLFHTTGLVGFNGFVQLPEAEREPVEVLDGFGKTGGIQTGAYAVEPSKGTAGFAGLAVLGNDFNGMALPDEIHHPPGTLHLVHYQVATGADRQQGRDFQLGILGFQVFLDHEMVFHQSIGFGEYIHINSLQDEVVLFPVQGNLEGIINMAIAEGLQLCDYPRGEKLCDDGFLCLHSLF